MLIVEDLLLLLTRDDTGKLLVSGTEADIALGGAVLIELTLADRVGVAGPGERVREGRLLVRDPTPSGDPVLDRALAEVVRREGKKPSAVVTPLGKGLRNALYERLVQRGILRSESGRILGIFPTQQWPTQSYAHESSLRARVAHALGVGTTDDERVAALVSLLHALRAVHKVVDPSSLQLTKGQLNDRAKQIADGDWASAAVRRAIDEMMAAVMVATTAGAAAAAGSS